MGDPEAGSDRVLRKNTYCKGNGTIGQVAPAGCAVSIHGGFQHSTGESNVS